MVQMNQTELRRKYRYYDQIQQFRLIDDTFMSVVFEDVDCTQFLVRTLLQDDDLTVTKVETQNSLKNLRGRSVRLDITAHDATGRDLQHRSPAQRRWRAAQAGTLQQRDAGRQCD